jgi:membrane-associated HD superfamily phosphohydrolase
MRGEERANWKGIAILISPIIGVFIVFTGYKMSSTYQHWNDFLLIFSIISVVAIFVQFLVEIVLYFLNAWIKITFENYLFLATGICIFISILEYPVNSDYNIFESISEVFKSFFIFYSYSIVNAFTYNYLYFKRL